MSLKLAIISPNRNKYSETFIHGHIENLPFEIVLYSEGYLPTMLSQDKGLSFTELSTRKKWWKTSSPEKEFKNSLEEQRPDVVLAEYGVSGVEVMNTCKELKIPLVVHFHGYDAYRNDVMANQGEHYSELFEIAQAVVAVSKDMREQLIVLGCPKAKVHLIPYGIDCTQFMLSNAKGMKFVSCGRFVEKKGPLKTIHAFKTVVDQFPNAQLVMIGDGELLQQAKELVRSLELENNIEFAGVCSRSQIVEIYRDARVYVQHSMTTQENDREGTPLSILEASASGLAVVATKHEGIKEAVQHEVTGILVEEGDVEAMGHAMLRLAEETTLASEMGKKGRIHIEKEYSYERYLGQLSELIRNCCIEKQ